MKQTKKMMTVLVSILLSLACFTACAQKPSEAKTTLVEGGTLLLKVNPEIEINYDKDGLVTEVVAKNDDAKAILATYTGFEGKKARQVVGELVNAIGAAGYFVEDVDGHVRQITIEIETGSKLPDVAFLDEIVEEARNAVNTNAWTSPVDVRNESAYGITDYIDTDYGPNSDGYTDYNDTDYGPNNDGITDYHQTDYGKTNYHETNYGKTDYHESDYGDSHYD